MTLREEALAYWNVMLKFKRPTFPLGKVHAIQVEIPTLYLRAKNPRIQMHLSNVMTEENIEHDHLEAGNE